MKIVIAGATGFIGQALVRRWVSKGVEILAIGRSKDKILEIFNYTTGMVTWDELSSKADEIFTNTEAVINLAGATIADKRWSKERKKEILESRLNATKLLADYCIKYQVPLLNASAIGIYGLQKKNTNSLPAVLDEDSPIASEKAKDFLSLVCRQWEEATAMAQQKGIRVVNLRMGVVLGKGGGPLSKIALPFYFFMGGPLGGGHQPFPWISLDDVCRAIEFLIGTPEINGPVNLVAPKCIKQRELAHFLGKALRRPSHIPTPGFLLKLILGRMATELLLDGQHVRPKKLLQAGFTFKYADIDSTLKAIYS